MHPGTMEKEEEGKWASAKVETSNFRLGERENSFCSSFVHEERSIFLSSLRSTCAKGISPGSRLTSHGKEGRERETERDWKRRERD